MRLFHRSPDHIHAAYKPFANDVAGNGAHARRFQRAAGQGHRRDHQSQRIIAPCRRSNTPRSRRRRGLMSTSAGPTASHRQFSLKPVADNARNCSVAREVPADCVGPRSSGPARRHAQAGASCCSKSPLHIEEEGKIRTRRHVDQSRSKAVEAFAPVVQAGRRLRHDASARRTGAFVMGREAAAKIAAS